MGILQNLATEVAKQANSNDGFLNGLHGLPPRTVFLTEMARGSYKEGYEKGQEAAKTRAINKASELIDKL